ncbi:MAG: S8 family serine peptidase, partial [Bacteriovoracaceae bacterium]
MFKNVFSTLVLVSTLSTFQAKANNFFPDSSNSFSSEELYSGYQWWYLSNEQFFNSEDRGSSIPVEKDADVNVSNYLDKIRSEFKRDVVVAVIDSGADLGHPDINFYTNKAECIDGVRPLSNITDKDENGFAGDCQGWDFTDDGNNPNEDLVKNPLQPGLVGHGTAVAGIIAAKTGNEDLGIAGLSNNIKVYPIKATSNSEKLVTRKGTLGDKFAKAIEYATSLNVDVINVSSGWPSIANSPEVEKALKNAYESGIFVVVATGNDGHDLDYFPCGLPYTICVGSTSPEKTFSEFSNFGGAVDILAPGEHVLSTNARHIYSKKFFNLPFHHYDIRSGTSFSAPVVSALIASLLGLETESPLKSSEEVDEVLGRLYSTAKSIKDENKWSNSGLIDFSKAFEKKSSDHVAPQFKGKTSFLLAQDLTFQYELKLKNYSKDNKVQNVVVEFSSEDFEQSKIVLSNIELSSYELKKIPLSLKAKSSAVDSRQLIAVKVQSEGQEKTYKTRISLEMKTQVAYKFKLHEDLSTARNTALKTPLGTVIQFLSPIFDRYSNYETNDYVSTRLSKKDGKKYLNIFKSTKDGIKPFSVELGEEVDRLYDLQKIDLNYDGKKDYLVITIFTEKNTPESQPRRGHLKLFFLDSDFNSLIDRKYIKYNDGHKAALTHFSDLSFYKAKVDGRDIALPYALANALRPEGAESPL